MASKSDVDELARWFAETHHRRFPNSYCAWEKLLPKSRNNYRAVARIMLDNPPDVLKRAVEGCKAPVLPGTGAFQASPGSLPGQ